jgi:exoribonuclease R
LVHRLLTICLKEQEHTRDKIDGLDYSDYAESISEKSFNSRKASKECQTLFHCFLLKDQGPRVYDCLIFDIDSSYLNIFVEELNLNLSVKLREDDRID